MQEITIPISIDYGPAEKNETILVKNETVGAKNETFSYDALLNCTPNITYSAPEGKSGTLPFILAALALIIVALFFIFGRKKKKEQTFDKYLSEMSKRKERVSIKRPR
ncbi:LPXTG cell wall anchor domain-containing protein [Candidatus Pacearchaeota archaeon]|nr:LPXTG cell wall anchor domain-containing protein [Candidatus Pacearchaeota archaeon]